MFSSDSQAKVTLTIMCKLQLNKYPKRRFNMSELIHSLIKKYIHGLVILLLAYVLRLKKTHLRSASNSKHWKVKYLKINKNREEILKTRFNFVKSMKLKSIHIYHLNISMYIGLWVVNKICDREILLEISVKTLLRSSA